VNALYALLWSAFYVLVTIGAGQLLMGHHRGEE
jgi:hypothetical protein